MSSHAARWRNNRNAAKKKSDQARQRTRNSQAISSGTSSIDYSDPFIVQLATAMNSTGTSEVSPSSSMTSFPSAWSEDREKLYAEPPMTPYRPRTRPAWVKHMSRWWPRQTYRWICDFSTALYRLFTGERWVDGVYSLVLLACFLYCFYTTMDGLLHLVKGAAAQDTDCSIVYVTIPGPIVTVSLIGQTPTDPSHGTYYYSVINGTTQWLDSITPPTRTKTFFSTLPVLTLTASAPGPPPTPGLPPPSSLPSTGKSHSASIYCNKSS